MTKVIEGRHYRSKEKIAVHIENGYIKSIYSNQKIPNDAPLIAPGLVDIQINGYRGIDFNRNSLNKDEWFKIINYLAEVGVTTFYPTIITNSESKLLEIFKQNAPIIEAINMNKSIGGFHLEGPYISPKDGSRGAHKREFVRKPNLKEIQELQRVSNSLISILTLSPEWSNTSFFLDGLKESDIRLAIGHTSATSDQIDTSVKGGVRLSTHLGNGSEPILPRHPNYIWDQLANDDLWASVIADGFHLPKSVLKVFIEMKKDKLILISDSVSLAGLPPGNYSQQVGGSVTLTEEGKLHLKNSPDLLAGSAQNLLHGIEFLVKNELMCLADAIDHASVVPAKLMNLPQRVGLEIGAPADIIAIDDCSKLRILSTYKNGQCLYER